MLTLSREQILAFRLQGHGLCERLPRGALAEAACCGVQNTPPGAALLAFHARVEAFRAEDLERANQERRLLQAWCMRAAPHYLPAPDRDVFTLGLWPDDEEALVYRMRGATDHLARFGMSAAQVVDGAAAALWDALDGRELDKDQLGFELARRLEGSVPPELIDLWRAPDGMTRYGESLARYALDAICLQGIFCIAPRQGSKTTFLRADQWLGLPDARPLKPQVAPETRVALVRRYLGAYGPSTAGDFAAWAGIAPAHAQRIWLLALPELEAVRVGRRQAWLWRADLPRLENPRLARGVRLLPPHDPYLALRDRAALVPDPKAQRALWRAIGSPGAALVDGEVVGLWRPEKRGQRLGVNVQTFAPIAPQAREALQAEAEAVAALRGCARGEVIFSPLEGN